MTTRDNRNHNPGATHKKIIGLPAVLRNIQYRRNPRQLVIGAAILH